MAPDAQMPSSTAPVWLTRRRRSAAAAALACYLSALLAVNLTTSPAFGGTFVGGVASHIFPRIGEGGGVDTGSIEAEWEYIHDDYVLRNVSAGDATQGAETGMVERLQTLYNDRFVALRTAATQTLDAEDLNNQRSGAIGIAVEPACAGGTACGPDARPSELVIEDVLVGQPAARAGVRNGDVLVAVGSTTVKSLGTLDARAIDHLSTLIRGAPGTTVSLTVQRAGTTVTLVVTRENLNIPSVYATRLGSVVYLEVTGFDQDTGALAKQLLQHNLAGATGIVLDLRDNGGGYVTSAQQLVSLFVAPQAGRRDVVVRRGRMDSSGNPATAQVVESDALLGNPVAASVPMAVLVNGNTASAAEITTAALHDYQRAVVVGAKTFGKGSVQVDFTLPDGNDLHLTVERWYGPHGENIDGVGIAPDQVVTLPSPDRRYRLDTAGPAAAEDAQLTVALAALGS